jgi:hypothetical protein
MKLASGASAAGVALAPAPNAVPISGIEELLATHAKALRPRSAHLRLSQETSRDGPLAHLDNRSIRDGAATASGVA